MNDSDFVDISIYSTPWTGGHELFIYKREQGKVLVAKPAEFIEASPFENLSKPGVVAIPRRSEAALQKLMDELWNLGVRPTHAKAGDAQIEAMNKHLQDMRHLAFKGKPPCPVSK